LTNLDGLQSLESIGGTIQITNNALLTNLYGLGSLTSVGVTFSIDNNAALENLGLGSLASVVGNLVISNNDALTNTAGTGSLISVGGALEIANNDVLTDLDGLDLSSVGGDFIIQGNAALTNLDGLESLSSIGGNLQINNNALLINLDGLGSLTSVDGNHLNILYNTVLVSFCGLYPLLNTQETIYWNCNNNGANPTVADIIAGGPCPPLPVELISFTASTNNSIVELHWQTETEVNNYGFEILRCSQNTNWLKIGFLEGYGNSNSPKSYSFTDKYPTGGCNFKYKLKQIDNDGSYEYSTEIEVKLVTNNFNLYQNYPNPFNPETKISYTVPKTSDIVMKVFDILGIEIETLFSEQKQTGTYEITWNAEDLPSGVYFYRIQAGSFVETKKMVLMK